VVLLSPPPPPTAGLTRLRYTTTTSSTTTASTERLCIHVEPLLLRLIRPPAPPTQQLHTRPRTGQLPLTYLRTRYTQSRTLQLHDLAHEQF